MIVLLGTFFCPYELIFALSSVIIRLFDFGKACYLHIMFHTVKPCRFSSIFGIAFPLVFALYVFSILVVGLTWLPEMCEKSDFPLGVERNKWKMFSHTLLGPGDGLRLCDM